MISYIVIGIGIALILYFVYTKTIKSEQQVEEENEDNKEKKIRQKITVNPETMKYGPVNIYYASHTGTAENFAEDLKEEGAQKGIWCEPINVKNFEEDAFFKSKMNIFVIATHYEGEPPDDAVQWWEWVQKTTKTGPSVSLKDNKFTLFALGDLTYKYYCKFGKDIDTAIEKFGLERVYETGLGSNDQNNIAEFFEEWKINLWNKIMDYIPKNASYNPSAVGTGSRTKFSAETIDGSLETDLKTLDSENYDLNAGKYIKGSFGELLSVKELRQKSTEKDSTLEFVFEYNSKTPYQTAGNLNIFPENSEENVRKALRCVGLNENQLLKVTNSASNVNGKLPCPELITAGNLFRNWVCLQGVLKKSVLKGLINYVKDEETAKQLNELISASGKAKLDDMTKKCFGLIDIITNFNIKLDVGEFLSIATRIVPRLYTIASSYLVNPKQITLVVAIEYAEINGQQVKYGLASQYFINLKQQFDSGKTVKARMLFQPSNFTLPTKKNTPCIFYGTGAGYAPFAGMIDEREYCLDKKIDGLFGKTTLFFGVRYRDGDYLYKERIMDLNSKGAYTATFEAFSRDDPNQKVYVHNILEHKKDMVNKLLYQEDGLIYVCGNLGMANSFVDTIKKIIAEIKNWTEVEAEREYNEFVKNRRINVEAWG